MKVLSRLLMVLLCVPCMADDADDLYESLEDVSLGRVFMTRADRLALDARRSVSMFDAVAEERADIETDGKTTVDVPRRRAAGYIASGDGSALVWINGGFRRVELTQAERLKFPGTVRIRSTVTQSDNAGIVEKPGALEPSASRPDEK